MFFCGFQDVSRKAGEEDERTGGVVLHCTCEIYVNCELRYSTEPHLGYAPQVQDGVPYYCVAL